jgi:hypothetical protein
MANFFVQPFSYVEHIQRVLLMKLSPDASTEVDAHPLRKDLGFTQSQVVLDSLIGSEEAFVILDREARRCLGVYGVAQQVYNGDIVIIPWFLSSGFESDPRYTRDFLRHCEEVIGQWFARAPHRTFINQCLNVPRITRWLKWLGFTVEKDPMKKFVNFWKGGS